MNFMKLFSQSDILLLQGASSPQEVQSIFDKKGINLNTVSSLLTDFYQFMTIQNFSVEQKHKVINLALQLLKKIPEGSTKFLFSQAVSEAITKLSLRDETAKLSFTQTEAIQIKDFLLKKIIPYFQLYEIVLDDHPHFTLEAKSSSIVTVIKEKPLQTGKEIDVEGVAILSEFIGIRAPKEEKKDVKKK